ncbi:oligogalacturonate lyase family protein [Paenibacillus plantarum]|uniref:oligogalacturonate lyase family protein n=1 Tax=Paenibacillus plantarum TaxID=2654975 RepID=UPI0014911CAE|nr:oligogalacturonate lyase family protein [Paenibacillus plantarum]
MKGDVYYSTITRKQDELTGVEVVQLTDNSGDTYHPYFTKTLIDCENSYVLVASNRSGSMQLYTLKFDDGQMVQITDQEGVIPFSSVLDAWHHIVYYFADRTLMRVRLDNLETEELMEIPRGFQPSDLSVDNSGKYLAFSYVEHMELCTDSGSTYSTHREKHFRRPRSVVIRFDIDRKTPYVVWGEGQYISHVNISPVDPNIIVFCHEGPWLQVQRMWTARLDHDKVYPLVDQKVNLERIGHEFFTASGRVGAQYSSRERIGDEFLLHGDIFINVDGSNEKRYYYPYTRPSHVQMNYGETMGVGDRAHIREVMKDSGNYMSLLKYDGDSIEVGLLCAHGTSWRSQMSHPHPLFTRDDRHILFSSDEGGKSNVYMARADWDKTLKSDKRLM